MQATGITVSGRVTDASGDGIQDVKLTLQSWHSGYLFWAQHAWANTGSDGSYTLGPFWSTESGIFLMQVAAPDDRFGDTTVPLEILTDAPVSLDIVLQPGGRISGRLKDPDGRPVTPQPVHLCRVFSATDSLTDALTDAAVRFIAANPGCAKNTYSDASANFEFLGVAAGSYTIRHYGRDIAEASVTVEEGGHGRVELEVVPWDYEFDGSFLDDEGSVHEEAINAVAQRGILRGTGCGAARICPTQGITRAVMAVWLGRALAGGEPQPVESSRFADVDLDGRHAFEAAHIERFAELGVTVGCRTEPLRYCPDRVVTRAQMATFLQRALDLDIPEAPAGFTDVDRSSVHARSIDALRASGITVGCDRDGTRYCPDQPVKRGQMATFINRALERLDEQRENLELLTAADIEVGDRLEAELASGVKARFRFQATAGQNVVIETHGDLDLVASLRQAVSGAPDEEVATDDDGGEGTNSRIDYSVTAPGWYIIEVRGYYSNTAGEYEISLGG